jgi:enoyl-CoA hydratase
MTDECPVQVRKTGQIGRLTLNRPQALHALTHEMCTIMADALREWRSDDSVSAVLVDHAAGTRGFCAGGDIRMLAESGAGDGVAATDFFRAEYRLNTLIKRFPKPFIAIMNGVTMGGGVGISVHGSHRIATENTVFAMPETGIGLFPDVGGGWFLPRLPGALGMWLALTGARLKGADVVAAKVATDYVPAELLANLVAELERADLSIDGAHLVNTLISGRRKPVGPAGFEAYRPLIDRCFGQNSVEDILGALSAEDDDWCQAQLKILATKSPQTLKVAFRQLREGAAFETFEDNMRNEFRIGWRQVRSADFLEGVRAVILDKDNAPVWPSGRLENVTDEKLDEIFAPLGADELTFE